MTREEHEATLAKLPTLAPDEEGSFRILPNIESILEERPLAIKLSINPGCFAGHDIHVWLPKKALRVFNRANFGHDLLVRTGFISASNLWNLFD